MSEPTKVCPFCEGGGLTDNGKSCDACMGTGSWCRALETVARELLPVLRERRVAVAAALDLRVLLAVGKPRARTSA